jgi:hypothetical protein
VLTTNAIYLRALADALEHEIAGRLDEPEGTATVTLSVTLAKELIAALRCESR